MSVLQTSEQNFFAQNLQGQDAELELFSVGDAAAVLECSTATVRRIADEMRLPLIRTRGGIRLLSEHQVSRIRSERERRAIEAVRDAEGRVRL